jgi:tRNA 2-thiouridine synthesizing protein B
MTNPPTTLHTVNKSPSSSQVLLCALRTAMGGDSILLIEDGVYAALQNAHTQTLINGIAPDIQIYALQEDLVARGLLGEGAALITRIRPVNYRGFVELSCEHGRTLSWF